jgi:hypothetical protein
MTKGKRKINGWLAETADALRLMVLAYSSQVNLARFTVIAKLEQKLSIWAH